MQMLAQAGLQKWYRDYLWNNHRRSWGTYTEAARKLHNCESFVNRRKAGSITAESVCLIRAGGSAKPGGKRCLLPGLRQAGWLSAGTHAKEARVLEKTFDPA